MTPTPKVFGCGLSRTGTTSLAAGLGELGFHTVRFPRSLDEASMHDAAVDISVVAWMPQLLTRHPDARWILTTRPLADWLRSMTRVIGPVDGLPIGIRAFAADVRQQVYGTDRPDLAMWEATYRSHERRVRAAVAPDHLLVLDLGVGGAWTRLGRFLGVAPPNRPFPHLNASDRLVPLPAGEQDG